MDSANGKADKKYVFHSVTNTKQPHSNRANKKGSVISMWLFHLHSAVKIQPFSPVFLLAGSTAKAFYRLILWTFKEKASTSFYDTAFFNLKCLSHKAHKRNN